MKTRISDAIPILAGSVRNPGTGLE